MKLTKIETPQPKAYVVSGNGFVTKIALYKKPNLIFRLFIWWAGWKVEEVEE
jgi:hypothetical protein